MSAADSDAPHGIVVGVDGSSWSQAAVRWAMAEATLRGVDLTIAHVITPLSASTLLWPGGRIPEEVLAIQDNDARRAIADAIRVVQENLTGPSRPQVRSEVLHGGVVPILTGLSRSAELMVVGPRGRNEQHRRLLGTVANGLIHHACCPVAIVHETGAARESARPPVLLGTDGSPASELATEIAFREAVLRGVDLVALHVLVDSDMSGLFAAEWSALQAVVQKPIAERLGAWEERYPGVLGQPRGSVRPAGRRVDRRLRRRPVGGCGQPGPRRVHRNAAGLGEFRGCPRSSRAGHRCAAEVAEAGGGIAEWELADLVDRKLRLLRGDSIAAGVEAFSREAASDSGWAVQGMDDVCAALCDRDVETLLSASWRMRPW